MAPPLHSFNIFSEEVLSCDVTAFIGSEDIAKDMEGEIIFIILGILLKYVFVVFRKSQFVANAMSRKLFHLV